MGKPVQDGEDELAELMSIEDESPTTEARLRIETETMKVAISVPPHNASHLLDSAVSALLIVAAVIAPMATLKAAPEDLPYWASAGMVGLQLGVVIFVAVSAFAKKLGSSNRLSS
ncbi:hypothetical protein [Amycolatopsis saalfeldensis]|uniref:Uncharacterized protein n=1 Tax=Amycolatopsis saalfeldensis TaxID=394193 RepID=A0A1H8Y8T9_9PSEU|nr:hypothetical protein [Amycolatopsis saalfeldensis]SEP48565.1 hypothetical protein SAMN04489732_11273 [Amycolatopsis saalfeldensis]